MEALLRQILRGTAVRLSVLVWLFGYVLLVIVALAQGRPGGWLLAVVNLPLMLLGVTCSVGIGLLLDQLTATSFATRWSIVGAAGLAAALLQTGLDHLLFAALALTLMPEWREWALSPDLTRKLTMLILYLWTIYLTTALTWASRNADTAKLNEARAANFAASAARAEAAALRLQLNPHFLFNTLNGIASLVVRERRDQAEEMIGRLADFLRSSLAADPAGLVPLALEIETARAYLTIEEARFGDRLRVEFAVDPMLEHVEVPNFILQPLVENAIQHGVATSRDQVTVRIVAAKRQDAMVLCVSNRGDRARTEESPPTLRRAERGIGLANTRSRLAAQYGARASLEARTLPDGYEVEISLPCDGRPTEARP